MASSGERQSAAGLPREVHFVMTRHAELGDAGRISGHCRAGIAVVLGGLLACGVACSSGGSSSGDPTSPSQVVGTNVSASVVATVSVSLTSNGSSISPNADGSYSVNVGQSFELKIGITNPCAQGRHLSYTLQGQGIPTPSPSTEVDEPQVCPAGSRSTGTGVTSINIGGTFTYHFTGKETGGNLSQPTVLDRDVVIQVGVSATKVASVMVQLHYGDFGGPLIAPDPDGSYVVGLGRQFYLYFEIVSPAAPGRTISWCLQGPTISGTFCGSSDELHGSPSFGQFSAFNAIGDQKYRLTGNETGGNLAQPTVLDRDVVLHGR